MDRSKRFHLVAGNAALDLVNTLDYRFRDSGPEELLESYEDLLRFMAQCALLGEEEAGRLKCLVGVEEGAQILERVKKLRETIGAVAYALLQQREVAVQDLAALEGHFKKLGGVLRLESEGGRLLWRWREIEGQISAPFWLLVREAEDLFLGDRLNLLRSCARETCQWLFLDTSKNHTRRWCDMKLCGNRMKAKRFQARQASS